MDIKLEDFEKQKVLQETDGFLVELRKKMGKTLQTVILSSVLLSMGGNALASNINQSISSNPPVTEIQQVVEDQYMNKKFDTETFSSNSFKPPLLMNQTVDKMSEKLINKDTDINGIYKLGDDTKLLILSDISDVQDTADSEKLKAESDALGLSENVTSLFVVYKHVNGWNESYFRGGGEFDRSQLEEYIQVEGENKDKLEKAWEEVSEMGHISISLQQSKEIQEYFSEDVELKTVVKGILYHEIAHAIQFKMDYKTPTISNEHLNEIDYEFDYEIEPENRDKAVAEAYAVSEVEIIINNEMFGDTYELFKIAQDLKSLENGKEIFDQYVNGKINFRLSKSASYRLNTHDTLPAMLPVINAINEAWHNIDKISEKQIIEISKNISNSKYIIDHYDLLQDTLPDNSHMRKTLLKNRVEDYMHNKQQSQDGFNQIINSLKSECKVQEKMVKTNVCYDLKEISKIEKISKTASKIAKEINNSNNSNNSKINR
jgi:hypothetical protein